MPIYEYECKSCGQVFEVRRSMADMDKEAKCPRCGVEDSRRLFSVFATSLSSDACAPSSPS